jgi:hypothetical protein
MRIVDASGSYEVPDPAPMTVREENEKLRELVEELLVVYFHQDDDRINQLRAELDI